MEDQILFNMKATCTKAYSEAPNLLGSEVIFTLSFSEAFVSSPEFDLSREGKDFVTAHLDLYAEWEVGPCPRVLPRLDTIQECRWCRIEFQSHANGDDICGPGCREYEIEILHRMISTQSFRMREGV